MAIEPVVRRALVIDADPALPGLLGEWLQDQGFRVCEEPAIGHYDLIVADVPYPRLGAPEFLKRLARAHPHTPILALSSNLLPGVDSGGRVARALGVSAVLPKPVPREILMGAVARLLGQAA